MTKKQTPKEQWPRSLAESVENLRLAVQHVSAAIDDIGDGRMRLSREEALKELAYAGFDDLTDNEALAVVAAMSDLGWEQQQGLVRVARAIIKEFGSGPTGKTSG